MPAACSRIVNRLRDFAEVASPFGDGRHRVHTRGGSLQLSKAFIICKKEKFVVNDRPSHTAAKLVLMVFGLRSSHRIEEIPCVEIVVSEKLEHAAVIPVRT